MWLFCHCHFFWFRKGLIPLAAGIAVESQKRTTNYTAEGGNLKKCLSFDATRPCPTFFPTCLGQDHVFSAQREKSFFPLCRDGNSQFSPPPSPKICDIRLGEKRWDQPGRECPRPTDFFTLSWPLPDPSSYCQCEISYPRNGGIRGTVRTSLSI